MAIKLNTSYSKKLGLPGYSSHAFSASVEVELADINQAGAECARLYGLLQANVDNEIRHTGFVPDDTYGMQPPSGGANGHSGNGSGMMALPNGANGGNGANAANGSSAWKCSPKQRDLILRILEENDLLQADVDTQARRRFGIGLTQLSKLQASGLIDELLERFSGRATPATNGSRS